MRQHGRKSAAQLSIVPFAMEKAPDAPAELTMQQRDIWKSITSRMPVDWFTPDTIPLLIALCRHICLSKLLGEELDMITRRSLMTEKRLARFERLQKMYFLESRAMCTVATKLRLTPQSAYDKTEARQAQKRSAKLSAKPWEIEE